MKVAYISTPHFADCDIPLIGELQKKIDLKNKKIYIQSIKGLIDED